MNVSADRQAPRVSVIMSVYNGADHLRAAVESILNQALTDYEFIIVDDASTDGAPRVLDEYADPRIVRLANPSNLGLAGSLNRGLAVARGEYIARQDADDVSMPDRLALQVAYLDVRPQVGVVGATSEWIDQDGAVLEVWRQPNDNAAIQETLLRYCCLMHGSTLIRSEAVSDLDGYDASLRVGQDYDLWLRLAESWDLACLPDVLYQYRWHPGMASKERQAEQVRNAHLARTRAVRRRLSYGWLCLGLRPKRVPPRLRQMGRRRLAERYVSWSAGSREISRRVALAFLVFALAFDITHPGLWEYMRGIVRRKVTRAGNRE